MESPAFPGRFTTFSYDPEGDRTSTTPPSGTAADYTYDQAERLIGVTGPTSASYSYNGDGLRMSKTVNGTTEQYTWNEASSLPLLLEDGSTDFIYGPGGLTLEQVAGGKPDYFLHDWQGSTMGPASETGALVASYIYDAYGNLTSSSGTASTPLLFQGQYQDKETGLYYLQSRYYDPSTGQFLSRDPENALVPYAYAVGDPINDSDPTGEMLTKAPGSTGPAAVAPPPATNQAAYYHQLSQETTPAPAPTPLPPQVLDSALSSAISAPTVAKSTGCSGFCPGQWAGAVTSGAASGLNWVNAHKTTIAHVGALAALVGGGCALGIISDGLTCAVAVTLAVGSNAALTAASAKQAAAGKGSWASVGIYGVYTLAAGASAWEDVGSVAAIGWTGVTAVDLQYEWDLYLRSQTGFPSPNMS